MSNRTAAPPAARIVKDRSVLTPVANTRRKIVRIANSQRVTDPLTEQHVALLPVRYAIAPRDDEPAYAYQAAALRYDLPAVTTARYVLRTLRPGYLYIHLEGTLVGLSVTANGHLRSNGPRPGGIDLLIERSALVLPTRYGEVEIAYSEHEWTARQCQRVLDDADGARTALMQRFNLAGPVDDACPLEELATQVEEYAGRADRFAWSDTPAVNRNSRSHVHLPSLAEAGQYLVALADPIGITHDYTALVERALGEVKRHVSDPDETPGQAAGMTAAGTNTAPPIPLLVSPPAPEADDTAQWDAARARYRKKLVAETIGRLYERHLDPETDPQQLARLRLEHWRKEPANRGKPEPPLAEFERDVVTSPTAAPGAARLVKHVDEDARRRFLTDYDAGLGELTRTLEGLRLDRLVWLNTWRTRGHPHSLHTAWETFDTEDQQDWVRLELSFARSIAALGMSPSGGPKDVEGAQARELELIGEWLAASLDDSPVYRALAGHPPLRAATAQLDQPNPLETAPDRSGATLDGIANVIDDLHRNFPYTLGTDEIVHSMTVYLLTKPTQWRGAVADNIDTLLARLAGNDDATTAVRALMARYGQFVTTTRRSLGEYSRLFVEAAGDPPGLAHSMEQLAKTGNLRADGYTTYEVHQTTTTRTAIAGKGQPNPFRGWGTVGISALAGMLYLVNLRMAVASFTDEKSAETTANLLSAGAAIGSGVNAGLLASQTATPHAVSALYRRIPAARALGGLYALRLFGYGGAFLTGATLGIHGGKLIKNRDTDAGLWYAASAVAATVGGSALTYASAALAAGAGTLLLTPVGWLIVGAVVVVASIKLGYIGDEAKDTALEQWLDACTFGKRELPRTKPFAQLSDEMDALGVALYAPTLIESDWSDRWGFPHHKAEAKVFLPAYLPGSSQLRVRVNGTPLAPVRDRSEQGGRLIEIETYLPKHSEITQADFAITYRPSEAIAEPYTLHFTVPGSD